MIQNNLKRNLRLLSLCSFLGLTQVVNAQISGTVFRDFNANGVKDNTATFNEPFAQGITVKAFNAANVQVGTTKTTDAAGAYSFTSAEIASGTPVRIEFSGLATGEVNSFSSASNGTNVQFATAPSTTTNYALNYLGDYSSTTNPLVVVPMLSGGSTVGNTQPSLGAFLYNASGIQNQWATASFPAGSGAQAATNNIRVDATAAQLGSVWGQAFQKNTNRIFISSYLKRGEAFAATGGPGYVYVMDYSTSTPTLAHSFNLQGVATANGGTIDLGTVNRTNVTGTIAAGAAGDYQMPSTLNSIFRDLDAFAKVGTMSYGDIDISEDGKTLWLVNLFQRSLIKVDVSTNTVTSLPVSGTVDQYLLANLPNYPTPNLGVLRPWGLKFYKGRGYLGVVNDASLNPSTTGQTNTATDAALRGYVLSFDPNNIAAGFTTEINIPLYFSRQANGYDGYYWMPWVTSTTFNTPQDGGPNSPLDYVFRYSEQPQMGYTYTQPIISDIEFDPSGNMLIGFKDRTGDQFNGKNLTNPISGATQEVFSYAGGDLLKACKSGSLWIIEGSSGSCPENYPAAAPFWGVSNNGEYFTDFSGDGTAEAFQGGLAILAGSNEVLTTTIDPKPASITTYNAFYIYGQGVQWSNLSNGSETDFYQVLPNTAYPGNPSYVGNGYSQSGKLNGLGDIEILAAPQPIQIGNRIWSDTDADGIQDADETAPGVPAGTTVTLRSPGVDGIYGNTDDQTWTTTTDANGNYYFSALSSADNRKPAAWTGVGSTILPNYDYRIEVAIPSGQLITTTDFSTNSLDNIDNDATASDTNAIVAFNTSATNHTYDIGFRVGCVTPSAPVLSVTNNTCTPVAAGSINVTTACGAGTHIEYSTDNGSSWSATAPTYSTTAMTVIARCVNDTDNTCVSANSAAVTTAPVTCPTPCPTNDCLPITTVKTR